MLLCVCMFDNSNIVDMYIPPSLFHSNWLELKYYIFMHWLHGFISIRVTGGCEWVWGYSLCAVHNMQCV